MLSVVLKILSILGILLLSVLGLAILLILLVLFFPVCYRVSGKKETEEMTVNARAWWLFGLLRVSFVYPEPGRVLVKVLPFTVYDSGKKKDGTKETAKPREVAGKGRKQTESGQAEEETGKSREQAETSESGETTEKSRVQTEVTGGGNTVESGQYQGAAEPLQDHEASQKSSGFSFLKKFGKIKYTIRSIYDKIKNIWENISYYIDLLREEETKLLFSHVIFRLGKILKSIRPRRMRGHVLFGTGAPDTTGYAYGVYGMLSSFLGSGLLVTPDFTRVVLEGDIYVAGHTTVFTILWNVLKVLLDKKLKRFITKMKAGRKR